MRVQGHAGVILKMVCQGLHLSCASDAFQMCKLADPDAISCAHAWTESMWRFARVRCGRCTDAIGITMTGEKEVLSLWLAQTEGAKFWLGLGGQSRGLPFAGNVEQLICRWLIPIITECTSGKKLDHQMTHQWMVPPIGAQPFDDGRMGVLRLQM